MNRHEFRNIYCILHSLDAYELTDLDQDEFDWPKFRDNPHDYFLKCPDGLADGIWKAVEKRMPAKTGYENQIAAAVKLVRPPQCVGCPYWRDDDGCSCDTHVNSNMNDKWQPIETAPKNCGWVLVYSPRSKPHALCVSVSTPYSHKDEWIGCNIKPTHWMPLPKPPEGATE